MELELLEYIDKDLPKGFTPYFIYLIMNHGVEVGKITLRTGNDESLYYAGHIGYTIYKEHRGHSYAYYACLLLQDLIEEDVYVTCDPQNKASLRTIEKLGCEFIEETAIPQHLRKLFTPEEKIKRIYKIPKKEVKA